MTTQYDDAYIKTLRALSDRDKLALILGQSLHISRLKTALGCPEALIDETVTRAEQLSAAEQGERARIVAALRKWATSMRGEEGPLDDDGLREAWKNEIDAAESFASQIESGAL